MLSSFVRLVTAKEGFIHVELSHRDSPTASTIFGTFDYDRVTGDIGIKWCYKCPLSLREKLQESIKFLKLCKSI